MYFKVSSSPIGCNIFAILLLVVLIVSYPQTLIFLAPIALVVLIPLALVAFRFAKVMWRVRRAQKQAYNNATNTQRPKDSNAQSGDVKIIRTKQTEQRVNDDVGEYVDFEEIE
jgi:hypothetical protein